ncbi:hypothetical protein HAX54_022135 [Datura stramonium]|uniref:Uncharacterized protein n=1 Tax=Datura stramonium TaxID=4076 RepID=A0ABS8UUI7_DATST|nr:hypothetical protein [Datura stramonium]
MAQFLPSDDVELQLCPQEDREVDDSGRTRKKILEDSEFVKFVVDSIINVDDRDKLTPPRGEERGSRHRNTSSLSYLEDGEPLLRKKIGKRELRIWLREPRRSGGVQQTLWESRHHSWMSTASDFRFFSTRDSPIYGEGTVGFSSPSAKETMYPHQRGRI